MRESFVFYKSFYEALQDLKDKDRLKVYDAICNLALNNKDNTLSGISKTVFTLIKPQIIANNLRYQNGKKGGRPKTNGFVKKETNGYEFNKTETKPNENVNENENVNVNENEKKNIKEIINYLNSKTGSKYKYTTKSTQEKINARLNEGFKLDDFIVVIDKKVKEWTGTDMEKYLRPETLFGTKFEGYLNQKTQVQNQKPEIIYTEGGFKL